MTAVRPGSVAAMAHRPMSVTGLNLEHVLVAHKACRDATLPVTRTRSMIDVVSRRARPLRAPLEIEFDYTRSLGPVLSQFMAALARAAHPRRARRGRPGARPPVRVRPGDRANRPAELVPVGPDGHRGQLVLDAGAAGRPAAGGAVRLGADPAGRRGHRDAARGGRGFGRGHADRAAGAAPVGRATRSGSIRDIACFEPCDAARRAPRPAPEPPPDTAGRTGRR